MKLGKRLFSVVICLLLMMQGTTMLYTFASESPYPNDGRHISQQVNPTNVKDRYEVEFFIQNEPAHNAKNLDIVLLLDNKSLLENPMLMYYAEDLIDTLYAQSEQMSKVSSDCEIRAAVVWCYNAGSDKVTELIPLSNEKNVRVLKETIKAFPHAAQELDSYWTIAHNALKNSTSASPENKAMVVLSNSFESVNEIVDCGSDCQLWVFDKNGDLSTLQASGKKPVSGLDAFCTELIGKRQAEESGVYLETYINNKDFSLVALDKRYIPAIIEFDGKVLTEADGDIYIQDESTIFIEYENDEYNIVLTYMMSATPESGTIPASEAFILEIDYLKDISKPVTLRYFLDLERQTSAGVKKVPVNSYIFTEFTSSIKENVSFETSGISVEYTVEEQSPDVQKTYNVKYHANGGAGKLEDNNPYLAGQTATLLSPQGHISRSAYRFVGWSTKSGESEVEYFPGSKLEVNGNINLYAQWRATSIANVAIREPFPAEGPWDLNLENHFAYLNGYPDGTIRPLANITREEAATIFFRLLTDSTRDRVLSSQNSFSDVEADRWSNIAISTLSSMGIINGYSNGEFKPEKNITRAEFVAMATRFDNGDIKEVSAYHDIVGHWAEAEINRAIYLGWVSVTPTGYFNPDEIITRAEVTSIVNRMLLRVVADEGAFVEGTKQWPDNNDKKAWFYLDIQEASNSHTFIRTEEGSVVETWEKITPNPDWLNYETYK